MTIKLDKKFLIILLIIITILSILILLEKFILSLFNIILPNSISIFVKYFIIKFFKKDYYNIKYLTDSVYYKIINIPRRFICSKLFSQKRIRKVKKILKNKEYLLKNFHTL